MLGTKGLLLVALLGLVAGASITMLMGQRAFDLIKLVVTYVGALLVVGMIVGTVVLGVTMIVMILLPARGATKATWAAYVAFLGCLTVAAICDPENRERAVAGLLLTMPAIYSFGHMANVIYYLVTRWRLPRYGEWFD